MGKSESEKDSKPSATYDGPTALTAEEQPRTVLTTDCCQLPDAQGNANQNAADLLQYDERKTLLEPSADESRRC